MGKRSREKQIRRGNPEMRSGNCDFQTGPEKTCLFIIRWGIYLSLLTPLFISHQFFFPFVAPKTILFRILVEIILAAYLFLAIHNRKYRPKISPLTISLTIFLAVFILASFTGINFSRSFWSTYERMTGVFTMLHLYAFFVVLVSVFRKREDWEKFLAASVIAGVLLSLYVLRGDLRGDEFSTRGGGTIGNTSFMAAYLLFNVFFAVILLLAGKVPWKIFSGISLLIMLPVFLSSTAGGAIASFFLGLFLLLLGYLFFSGKKILRRIALSLVLLSILSIILLVLIQPTFVESKIQFVLSDMKSRLIFWEKGMKGFMEKPILGWGPENFNVVFLKYFNPCMFLPECGNEVWFDRVHNIIFDTLVSTGIVGLISYLAIFFSVIYGLIMIIPKIVETKNVFFPLGLIVILLSYFLQNLLVFDTINSYLLFFLTLAFAGFLIQGKEEKSRVEIKPLGQAPALMIVVLTISFIWFGNIRPLMANSDITKMAASFNIQDIASFFQKSLDSWMDKYEAREQFTQKLIKSGGQLSDLFPEEKQVISMVYELGESEMEKSIRENYLDFRHRLFLAELYLNFYRVSGNREKLEKAERILEEAVALSPTNQQGYWQLAEVKISEGKYDEAVSIFKKAVELEPRVGKAHWNLALGYRISGDYRLSVEEAKKAKENGYNWLDDLDNVRKISEVLNELGEDPAKFLIESDKEMLEFALNYTKVNPYDYNGWVTLATAYANFGQYKKAAEAAQKVVEIKPDLRASVEEFLKSLPK